MGLSKTRFIIFRMGKSFQIGTENTDALTELLKDIWLSSERREEKLWFVLFLSFLHSHYIWDRNNAETTKTTLRSNQLISIFPVIKAAKQIIPKLVPKTTSIMLVYSVNQEFGQDTSGMNGLPLLYIRGCWQQAETWPGAVGFNTFISSRCLGFLTV